MRIDARGCSISIVVTCERPDQAAARALDADRHAAERLDERDGAPEPRLRRDEPGRKCDDDEEQDRESREQPSNPLSRRPVATQNSGVKLTCSRGLRSDSEIDCATSMPMLRKGNRYRRPMPTEYSSGSPNLLKALPASTKTAPTQVLRKVALEFDARGQEVTAADLVAVRVDRRELFVAIAAHAVVAAREEAVAARAGPRTRRPRSRRFRPAGKGATCPPA